MTKALEEERVTAEKPTPTFGEHVLFELIEKLEKATGVLVFPIQINNTQRATRIYDCARRDRLPSEPDMMPTTIGDTHTNTSRWIFTLLVSNA